MYIVVWTIVLASFWLLLSGFFQPLLLGFGIFSVVLVVWLLLRMNAQDNTPQQISLAPKRAKYLLWLLGQIVSSSIEVAKAVWRSPKKLNPALAEIPTKQLQLRGRVLYANSITLTPGTLSVDVSSETVTVHALHSDSLASLETGDMEVRVMQVVSTEMDIKNPNKLIDENNEEQT